VFALLPWLWCIGGLELLTPVMLCVFNTLSYRPFFSRPAVMQDTSGPSLNILMKLMAIISLVFADFFFAIK
jgi:hypothetical protein